MDSTGRWRAATRLYRRFAPRVAVLSALAWVAAVAFAGAPASAMTGNVYVTNLDGNAFSQYGIGTGELLSALSPASVENETESFAVAASPDGKSVYVADKSDEKISQYSVGAGGLLSPKSPATVPAGSEPWSVAVSPDGKSVYVVDAGEEKVSQYSVGAGGVLEAKLPATVKTGKGPWSVIVSPDGGSVYVTDHGESKISQYNVGAGGVLEPKSTPEVLTGNSPEELAISPGGTAVYVADNGENKIAQYTVGAGGLLEAKSLPISTGTSSEPEGIVVSPDGASVYTGDVNGHVSQLSVGASGVLEAKSPLTVASALDSPTLAMTPDGKTLYVANYGTESPGEEVTQFGVAAGGLLSAKVPATIGSIPEAHGIVVLPDPGPVASFTATAGSPGSATSFNASESSDADGAVVTFNWSFGDGATAANGGAAPTHTYASPGNYTVTLTVTDETGCSTALVFTGRTAYCASDSAATTTRTVTVPAPPTIGPATEAPAPTLSSLGETAKTWREGNALAQISASTSRNKKAPPLGTTFSFVLNESASVVFTFTEPAAGRRVGKSCVAQTNKNKHKRRCTRTVTAGKLTFSAHAGSNKVHFDGLISRHAKLKPGSYTLLLSATAAGRRSTTGTLHFTIVHG